MSTLDLVPFDIWEWETKLFREQTTIRASRTIPSDIPDRPGSLETFLISERTMPGHWYPYYFQSAWDAFDTGLADNLPPDYIQVVFYPRRIRGVLYSYRVWIIDSVKQ